MKILIVDDSEPVRRLIAEIIKPFATEILECASAAAAISLCATRKPALVLTEIRVSDMNGIEATRRMRAAHPEAKIVIVTSDDDARLKKAAFAAGACDYRLKENLPDLAGLVAALTRESPSP